VLIDNKKPRKSFFCLTCELSFVFWSFFLFDRKLQPLIGHQSKNLSENVSTPKTSEETALHHSTAKNTAVVNGHYSY